MKRFDDINVIPFIDIMLVLLAIVLTTATFIAQGKIDVTLPEAESAKETSEEPPARITIDSQGRFHFNGEAIGLEALEKRLDGLKPEDPVVLRVDKGVAFGRFVSVMDALKARGLNRLSIQARQAGNG
ncbi:ExbD/TolR family protein [Thiohalorhabdus sp. Cl-TMA]|uniref:ExbD/TolR family protein n=1 Tax=Thiohalorhabdus methylotrophus TaxID=3242694 RepID=A0ABV4U256_9GAMM